MKDSCLMMFHSELRDTARIIEGLLIIIDLNTYKVVDEFSALSGAAGWQSPSETSIRGKGPIPEPKECNVDCFWLWTRPKPSFDVPGIRGNSYVISTEPGSQGKTQMTVNGVQRNFIELHFDADGRGTAGCIGVVRQESFSRLENFLKQCREKGVTRIPLQVSHKNGN